MTTFITSLRESQENLQLIIYSDSQEALKALKNPGQQSAQFLIRNIIKHAAEINQLKHASICYQWCPGHSKVPGNEEAHGLSRKATEPGSVIQLTPASKVQLLASVLGAAKSVKLEQRAEKFYATKVGRFTKSFGKALPGPHTRLLYNGRVKLHANVLCQLRSGINRLNKYLAKINAVEIEQCKCDRGEESVDHFLFRCPRWSSFRGEIRRLAGHRWGDTSYLLGGVGQESRRTGH